MGPERFSSMVTETGFSPSTEEAHAPTPTWAGLSQLWAHYPQSGKSWEGHHPTSPQQHPAVQRLKGSGRNPGRAGGGCCPPGSPGGRGTPRGSGFHSRQVDPEGLGRWGKEPWDFRGWEKRVKGGWWRRLGQGPGSTGLPAPTRGLPLVASRRPRVPVKSNSNAVSSIPINKDNLFSGVSGTPTKSSAGIRSGSLCPQLHLEARVTVAEVQRRLTARVSSLRCRAQVQEVRPGGPAQPAPQLSEERGGKALRLRRRLWRQQRLRRARTSAGKKKGAGRKSVEPSGWGWGWEWAGRGDARLRTPPLSRPRARSSVVPGRARPAWRITRRARPAPSPRARAAHPPADSVRRGSRGRQCIRLFPPRARVAGLEKLPSRASTSAACMRGLWSQRGLRPAE